MGLVTQVFDERRLAPLEGHLAIGHVRYSTTGSSSWRNAQPVYRSVGDAGFALGHNGNLTNTAELAARLGMLPGMTAGRDELRLHHRLRARRRADRPRVARRAALRRPRPRARARAGAARACGAASRSCSWTTPASSASATRTASGRSCSAGSRAAAGCSRARPRALDIVGAHYVRDVEPGEMVVIDATGVRREHRYAEPDPKLCLFEFVYFARPDTQLYGQSVHAARQRMGEELARQAPVDGRHGHAGPRVGHPRRAGLRPRVGHPLRRRPREEPLRRPHVHPAQPADCAASACA